MSCTELCEKLYKQRHNFSLNIYHLYCTISHDHYREIGTCTINVTLHKVWTGKTKKHRVLPFLSIQLLSK